MTDMLINDDIDNLLVHINAISIVRLTISFVDFFYPLLSLADSIVTTFYS